MKFFAEALPTTPATLSNSGQRSVSDSIAAIQKQEN
jgi:hypothetical protein